VFFRRCSFFDLDPSLYPYFDLYPAQYGSRPMLDPSPGKKQNDDKESLSPVLRTGYPSFRLCTYRCLLHIGLLESIIYADTSVYPNFDLYPGPYWSTKDFNSTLREDLPGPNLRTAYPSFNLCTPRPISLYRYPVLSYL